MLLVGKYLNFRVFIYQYIFTLDDKPKHNDKEHSKFSYH